MRSNWKQVERIAEYRGFARGMLVSLSKPGELYLNVAAHKSIGTPEAVEIYFDSINNRFGLKPSRLTTRNAFPLRNYGPSNGRVVRMNQVLRSYKIDLPATIQFSDIEVDDDNILVLDLRTARVPTRVTNHRDNQKRRNVGASTI